MHSARDRQIKDLLRRCGCELSSHRKTAVGLGQLHIATQTTSLSEKVLEGCLVRIAPPPPGSNPVSGAESML